VNVKTMAERRRKAVDVYDSSISMLSTDAQCLCYVSPFSTNLHRYWHHKNTIRTKRTDMVKHYENEERGQNKE